MRTLVFGGRIVNEDNVFAGSVVIDGDRIAAIEKNNITPRGDFDRCVDATGCIVMPGIIDEHVHFREPGMTAKADIESESRAAAFGGVTSYLEMPNTVPQTTTLEAWCDKMERGARESHVNYGFFFGATGQNAPLFKQLDRHRVPGIKLFMGSSTGGMLVDGTEPLRRIFKAAADLRLPLMTHCEDSAIIDRNMAAAKAAYGDDPPIALHPSIRSAEACLRSSALAIKLAKECGTRLHIAHVTTKEELELVPACADEKLSAEQNAVSLEAVVPHLWFSAGDYVTKGALIKCNPAVKGRDDREALRRALSDGRISTVATDHAPHLREEKQGGAAKAKSGMPMVQFSLVAMLQLVDKGVLTLERLVELMCHNPARLFNIDDRGFLRPGYKADLVVVKPNAPWTLTDDMVESKCKWTPMAGQTFHWQVMQTICNGHLIYNKGQFDGNSRGEGLTFRKDEP